MSTFAEAAHPRAGDGRFTAVTLSGPSLQLPTAADTHFTRRAAVAAWVRQDFADLQINDHSPTLQGTVTLAQLGDPRLAIGNCWAATNEVIEEAGRPRSAPNGTMRSRSSAVGWAARASPSWSRTWTACTWWTTRPASSAQTCPSRSS
ncbi:hypothetical protein ACVWYS_001413 [Arthrobacter sp. TE12231]